jgi:hypothetical protein
VGAERWSTVPAVAYLVGADALLVAGAVLVARALPRRWRSAVAGPVLLGTVTVGVIAADLVTGSRGQLVSLIGYSPIEGGRFYGLSPVSFAVLATYVLVLTGLLAGARPRGGPAVAAGVGALTVLVAGAPVFGAKFGSVLTLVPAFGVLILLVSGRRISLRRVLGLGAAALAVAVAFGVADALRPAASRTHIGRFVAALLGGGPGSVSDVLIRKADTNVGIFVRSPVALLIPPILVFLWILVLRPPAAMGDALNRLPGLRAGILAAIAANGIALLVNDSGVIIPAVALATGLPFTIALLAAAPSSASPDGGTGNRGGTRNWGRRGSGSGRGERDRSGTRSVASPNA